jgi:hypothetical protein
MHAKYDSTSDRILHLSGLELNRLMCASDDARSLVIDEIAAGG